MLGPGSNHTTIENNNIVNKADATKGRTGAYLADGEENHEVTIHNNYFSNWVSAVGGTEDTQPTITENEFHNNRNAIGIAGSTTNIIILDNDFLIDDVEALEAAFESNARYVSNRGELEGEPAEDVKANNTFDPDARFALAGVNTSHIVPEGSGAIVNVVNIDQETGFDEIQPAINAADPGDTIVVEKGTYDESLEINKDLTLLGAQAGEDARGRNADESIITSPGEDAIFIEDSVSLVLDGFYFDDVQRFILTDEFGDMDIRNNVFTNAESIIGGYFWFRDMEDNATADFTFKQNYLADNPLSNGLRIRASNGSVEIDISDNLWENNDGWALNINRFEGVIADNEVRADEIPEDALESPFEGQWGMILAPGMVTDVEVSGNEFEHIAATSIDFYGGFEGEADVTNNTIKNSFRGIGVREDADVSNVSIESNTFEYNETYVLDETGVFDLDAILEVKNNTFDPEAVVYENSIVPAANVNVVNTDQNTGFDTIQAAVDAADPDNTIEVKAGTYEGFTVDKNLTLLGPNEGVHHDAARNDEAEIDSRVYVKPDTNLTMDGFKVSTSGEPALETERPGNKEIIIRNSILKAEGANVQVVYVNGGYDSVENLSAPSQVTLKNNEFIGVGLEGGVGVGIEIDEATIENNRFDIESTYAALEIFTDGDGTTFIIDADNTFEELDGDEIRIDGKVYDATDLPIDQDDHF